MSPGLIITLALVAVVIYLYNSFIKQKNMLQEAWSGIDVQLKRRHSLIPNLVETVKGYASHEKEVLERVTKMRSGGEGLAVGQAATAESELTHSLKSLFALAEAYPDLKANQNFQSLQNTLIEVEDQIQFARRYYNGSVRNFNVLVNSFPSNILAKIFSFKPAEFFEIELTTEREVPNVKL